MKIFSIINTLLLLITLSATAQPTIDFAETKFDFGSFPERKSLAKHNFMFINNGNQPLIITNVKSTCGCTSPRYTKEPIAAGDTGYIYVTYFATGRPGKFNRAIKVASNAKESVKTIYISGDVIRDNIQPSPEKEGIIGGLMLRTTHFNLGNINKGSQKVTTIPVVNSNKERCTIKVSSTNDYIVGSQIDIEPNREALLKITYNSDKCDNWGVEDGELTLTITGADNKSQKLTYYANIVEDFSSLSATDRYNAPKISLSEGSINIKDIDKSVPTERVITIKNSGKSTLDIHKISSPSPAISIVSSCKSIAAGGSADIKVAITPSKSRSNIVNDYIVIISNDPTGSVKRIQVTATSN